MIDSIIELLAVLLIVAGIFLLLGLAAGLIGTGCLLLGVSYVRNGQTKGAPE